MLNIIIDDKPNILTFMDNEDCNLLINFIKLGVQRAIGNHEFFVDNIKIAPLEE